MHWFSFGNTGSIRLVPVDLGVRTVDIPVANITGSRPGRTLLVTGGMDGDEYAGIEAAYALIDTFASGNFAGRLIVVPIVNIPGFEGECSQNPMDGQFPKMRFLGREGGGPTDRLMHWLSESYVQHADCWYDLHSGAITEGLQPFLWLYRTRHPTDALNERIITAKLADVIVEEPSYFGTKAAMLARQGCSYILAESGARGKREAVDIQRHVAWVRGVMSLLGMIDDPITPVPHVDLYTRVSYFMAPFEGIWRPGDIVPEVEDGTLLGTCTRLDAKASKQVFAQHSGIRLWWKETMALRKGDVLAALARK